ncbi:carbohydrate ABC transporter permease [Paenibacillus jiagnxiensis]|uniref:carbohydrate ABC transporter permease n=1 Tax=Paenibacillus jiagnxiensis TaxID=3228926 RepID=UPI00339E4AC0
MKQGKSAPYLFLLPALAGLSLFKLYPLLAAVWDSLFRTDFLTREKLFVAAENYITLFQDPVFWQSLKVTLLYNVLIDPIIIVLALALSLLLQSSIKGRALFRTIHFIPVAISIPTACVIWGIMLSPEQGVVNSILGSLGLQQQPFLSSVHQSLASMISIVVWKSVGYWALFLLAGLQEVPAALYEAASIDGANRWAQFRHITIPLLRRPIAFVAVAVTSHHFFSFSPMYILTQGGPEHSTNTLMLESFNSAFLYSDPGRASAIVVLLIILTMLIITLQLKWLRTGN